LIDQNQDAQIPDFFEKSGIFLFTNDLGMQGFAALFSVSCRIWFMINFY